MDIYVYVHVNKVTRCECVNTIIGGGGSCPKRLKTPGLGDGVLIGDLSLGLI